MLIYNMMRLFWKINEYTKRMALMYNCWHTRKREEDKLFLLNMTLIVNKCGDRLTLPSTQMSRVILVGNQLKLRKVLLSLQVNKACLLQEHLNILCL